MATKKQPARRVVCQEHYWLHPHCVIEGRRANEIAVVRYCGRCGRREVAFAANWRKATGDYALDEHYAD